MNRILKPVYSITEIISGKNPAGDPKPKAKKKAKKKK